MPQEYKTSGLEIILNRIYGHRRGGAQAELAPAGVVQLAGDVQVEEAQPAARLEHHPLDGADRRDHVVARPVRGLRHGVPGAPAPGQRAVLVQVGADAAGSLGGRGPHGDEAVEGDQHRPVTGLDDGVLTGDVELAGGVDYQELSEVSNSLIRELKLSYKTI